MILVAADDEPDWFAGCGDLGGDEVGTGASVSHHVSNQKLKTTNSHMSEGKILKSVGAKRSAAKPLSAPPAPSARSARSAPPRVYSNPQRLHFKADTFTLSLDSIYNGRYIQRFTEWEEKVIAMGLS